MENGQHTPGPTEGKIGRVLEQARMEKGLTLEEAEGATKIRKRYLVGLERGDHAVLPDAVYAKGFLKTYANFLDLDGDGLSRELRTRRRPRRERGTSRAAPRKNGFERPIIGPGGFPGSERRRASRSTTVTVVVAALVIAALLGALYFVGLGVRSSAVDDAPRADRVGADQDRDAAPEGPKPTADEGSSPEEVPPDTLTVGVEVEGAPAWIRVRSDSETVFEEIAEPGFSRTFEARRVVGIRAGDAGAVFVEVNGQDVGALGDPGQVLDRNFTLKSAS